MLLCFSTMILRFKSILLQQMAQLGYVASCSIVAVQSDRDSRGFSFSPHKHECDSPENVNAKWDSWRSLISPI